MKSVRYTIYAITCGLAGTISGILIAVITNDPYFVRRVGTIILMLAAIAVYAEFSMENNIRFSERAETLELEGSAGSDHDIMAKLVEQSDSLREARRKDLALCVLIMVVWGEFLHGWGDLLV